MMANFYVWIDRDIDKLKRALSTWNSNQEVLGFQTSGKDLAWCIEEIIYDLSCHLREIERMEERQEYKEKLPYESFDGSKWELNKDR